MKKALLLVICVLVSGCSGNAKRKSLPDAFGGDPYESLAERLSEAHDRVANRKVAVLPFSYTDKRESDDGVVVSERLLTRIIQERKLEAVERNLLEKVMGELKLQYSGAVDETSIKNLGKVLGVDAVVTGTIMRQADGRIEINARLIKAETAVILAAAVALVPCDWETGVMPAAMEAAPAPEDPSAAPQPAPESGPAEQARDWKYRENLRVAEKSGVSLVDHQVLVKFDSATPIRLGRMKPDCSDLRFYNSNETSKLNYWLERGCNNAETRVWVRLPFLARNSVKNIYMHYGNPASGSESSGEATFVLFDGFQAEGVDRQKWRFLEGDCPVRTSNGVLEFQACGTGSFTRKSAMVSLADFKPPYVVEFDGWASDSGANGMYRELDLRWDGEMSGPSLQANSAIGVLLYDGSSSTVGCDTPGCMAGEASVNPFRGGYISFTARTVKRPLTPGVWRSYRVTDDGTTVSVFADGEFLVSSAEPGPSGSKIGISAREYPAGGKVRYDNFRVRAFAVKDPEVYFHRKKVSALGKVLKGGGI